MLGGGGFLGHHVVTQALAAGHAVTTFSRAEPGIDGVEALVGDRSGDLAALQGRDWDAVLDTFSDPDAVAAGARLLSGHVSAYGYVSGMSVYAPDGPSVPDETAPVRTPGAYDDRLQERSVAKLACERAVHEGFDGPALVVRVGIMVGPRDPSQRFSWWPVRFARVLSGAAPRRVLAPGNPDRPVQYSDARDISAWTVQMLAGQRGGTFNAVGPGRTDSLREVLDGCLRAAGGAPDDVELVWAGEQRLRAALADVDEEQRPLWFPEDQIPQEAIDSSAALAEGLTFRPAEQTARDVLAELDVAQPLAAGLCVEREQELAGRA